MNRSLIPIPSILTTTSLWRGSTSGIKGLQEERQRYEAVLGKLLAAAEADNRVLGTELLAEPDDWRDDFDRKIDAARSEMRRLAGAAIVGTRAVTRSRAQ
jgi:hypothetical protein